MKFKNTYLFLLLIAFISTAFILSGELENFAQKKERTDTINLAIEKNKSSFVSPTIYEEARIKAHYFQTQNGEWLNKADVKNQTDYSAIYQQNKKAEEAITLIKNECNFFPLPTSNSTSLILSVGEETFPFTSMLSNLTNTMIKSYKTFELATNDMHRFKLAEQFVIAVHLEEKSAAYIQQKQREITKLVNTLPDHADRALIVFGSQLLLHDADFLALFDAVVIAYNNTSFTQNRTAQIICAALPMQGKLPHYLNESLPKDFGISYPATNRLAFVDPEEFKLSQKKLNEIDSVLIASIADGVFPGCQVAFAYKGKVVYNKSFGKMTYEGNQKVKNDDLYDVASVTKIVSSAASLMYLQSQGTFNLDEKLIDLLPEIVKGTNVQNLTVRSMLAHQAGFKPYFPFYKNTISNGNLNDSIYSTKKTTYFNKQVAKDIWINEHYRDTLMQVIANAPRPTPGKYKYSDVGYYFVERIIEKLGKTTQDQFVKNAIYKNLGLNRIGYNPLTYYPLNKIAPTENDFYYRKQIVHGFVHDQGAAMQGGVAGHAGIFSNATDLLAVLQLFLNKGNYAGQQFIKKEIVEEYTRAQFPGNRRGAGFDRPTSANAKGPTCELASPQSYGHSGFTGTFVWVDPKYDLVYVFLSNRVYPDAENWKILKQGTRTKVQRMIYEIIQQK